MTCSLPHLKNFQPISKKIAQIKKVEIVDRIETAVCEADVVNVATSGEDYPYIKEDWLEPGVFVSLPASIRLDEDFVLNRATLVIDNWKMYEAWQEELDYPFSSIMGLIGTYYLDWIHDGKMDPSSITNLGEIVSGTKAGRKSNDEKILFAMGGMPVYDVAWSYEIYLKASEMGLGTKLDVWETPYLY